MGNPSLLRRYIEVNALLCLVNYPLTMVIQVISPNEKMFYMLEILVMMLLKVLIQFTGVRVIAVLENPKYQEYSKIIRAKNDK